MPPRVNFSILGGAPDGVPDHGSGVRAEDINEGDAGFATTEG